MRSSWFSLSPHRTLREVGRELGVNHETLRNWAHAAKRAEQATASGGAGGEPLAAGEREELRRLRRRLLSWSCRKEILRA